jgi:predicted HTH transcriptional regulator
MADLMTREFKTAEQGFDKNKLGQYFSALSNEANLANKECAWLIFGINDKHKVFGTSCTTSKCPFRWVVARNYVHLLYQLLTSILCY